MTPIPAAIHFRTDGSEPEVIVPELIRRVSILMKKNRYPLWNNQRVDLKVPFLIKQRKTWKKR
jgi:hypothetical protein